MTATGLERTVRQHDNDISAMYSMIADIQNTQRRHTNRFNELTEDVAAIDTRLTSVESGLTSVETRLTSLEGKVDQVLDLLRR